MAKQELITPAGRSCCRRRSLVFSFFFLCPERWCQKRDLASWAQHLLPATKTGPSLGQKLMVEKLWREFFSDPSQWWDNRVEKMSARYPDFKHKLTQEALWLDSKLNPAWVKAELSAMAPGTVQSDIFSWNVRLARFVKAGQYKTAIELFQQLQQEGMIPDTFTFVQVLNACAGLQALEEGRHIHAQIMERGCESNVFVGTSLLYMYAKCGSIEDAWRVFNRIPTRNVVTWNAMIFGHVKCGQGHRALELYQQMQHEGVKPVPVTFIGVLNACASVAALEEGRRVHEQIIEIGCESDIFVSNSLMDMYAKCGSMEDAWRVFNQMPIHDVVSWSALILGHVKCGQGLKGLELFQQMQCEGVEPNSATFMGVLNVCASLAALEEGRHIHSQIIKCGLESDVFVSNSLVDMYAKCGSIEDAWKVFNRMPTHDVVSWSAIILGHVKCGHGLKALGLYQQMQQEGVKPVPVTFVGILNACASLAALEEGRRVHEQIIESGFESDVFVCNSLLDMYAKCGSIEDALRVFSRMATRDVVSWSAMILGHVKCGQGLKALELFQQMKQEGVEPDPVTFVGVLNACASVAALEEGRHVHERIIQSGCATDVFVGSSLVDMYAKCGSLGDAQQVFNNMATHNVVTWNAMLGGYAMHGHGTEACRHFRQMCEEGLQVDDVSFVCLLSACSHAGLVDEGICYFDSMGSVYKISARAEHYTCMVDLLGRAGRLHEAEDMINTMSCTPNVDVWKALLGACRIHGNVEMGERVAMRVLEFDPGNATGYVLLSNINAAAGKQDPTANLQQQRRERVKKRPACTWIEVNNKVHSFVVDDQDHPQMIEIHSELNRLTRQMKEAGYVPDTKFVLHDVDEEEKLFHLCHHSEKLAIAFGLISTPPGTPLRIFKNLRVCGDCHTWTKFVTKIVKRSIVMRDVNRFHHFEDSFCTCRDYW